MVRYGILFLAIACDSDKSLTVQNPAPQASIISPNDGSDVLEGFPIELVGSVTDSNHMADELEVTWYVGSEIACETSTPYGQGDTTCNVTLLPEDREIRLEVRDPENARGEDSITVFVVETEQPVAEIISPVAAGIFYSDQLITFEGILSDAEDDAEQLVAFWESNLDGVLEDVDTTPDENGEVLGYATLSEGQHAIELEVEDTTGKSSRESVIITVGPPNSKPTCSITAPVDGSTGMEGETVSFMGMTSDADVDSDWLSVAWGSDKDGDIGSSTPTSAGEISFSYADLSVNTHTITMVVTDEMGATCTTAVNYTVGTAPSITIDSPVDNQIYSEGESVDFMATVSDEQSQPGLISLDWALNGTSISTQGATSSGIAQFSDGSLSYGSYNLAVTATDPDGLTDADQISFTVNGIPTAPTISIDPISPNTSDALTVNIDNPSMDPEGVMVFYSYQWLLNNVVQSSYTTATIPSSSTNKGEEWTVRVTASDGIAVGAAGEATVTIQNTPPALSGISISPSGTVYNDDILTCSVTVTDPDESLTPDYEWMVGGNSVGTSSSLDLSSVGAMPTDTVTCAVSVTDSDGAAASDSINISLDNRAPVLSGIQITPNTGVTTTSSLSCSASVTDNDGEVLSPSYSWMIGSNTYSGASLDLDPSIVSPNDTVSCTADVFDSYGGSDSMTSSVTVDNSLSNVDSITLSSPPLYTNDTIVAQVVLSDDDSSQAANLTASYEWHVIDDSAGGIDRLVTGATGDSLYGGNPDQHFGKNDDVYVIVTPNDGIQDGNPLTSGSVSISNSLPASPVISAAGSVSTPAIMGAEDLICSIDSPATDIDPEDSISYTYDWVQPDGSLLGGGGTSTANTSDNVAITDVLEGTWTCQVTPSDGQDDGSTASTSILVEAGCYSLDFDSANNAYISTDFEESFTDFTAEVWLRVDDYSSSNMRILDQDEAFQDFWLLGIKPNGNPFVYLRDSSSPSLQMEAEEDIVDGHWHHLAYVRNGGDNFLYVDGVLLVQDSYSSFQFQPASPLAIGYTEYSGAPAQYFDGDINAIRLSDTPLYTQDFTPAASFPTDSSTLLNIVMTPSQIVETSGYGYSFTNNGAITEDTCPEEDLDVDGIASWEDCDDSDGSVWDFGSGESSACSALSCEAILAEGHAQIGDDDVYWIDPDENGAFEVYCDMTHDGGGWALLAKFSVSGSDWNWNSNNWSSSFTFAEIETLNQTSDVDARSLAWSRLATDDLRLNQLGTSSSTGAFVIFPNPNATMADLIAGGTQILLPSAGDINDFSAINPGFQGNSGAPNNEIMINYNTNHTSSYSCCDLANRVRLGAVSYAVFTSYPNGAANAGYTGIGGTTVFRDGHEASCCNYSLQAENHSNTSGDSIVLWGK